MKMLTTKFETLRMQDYETIVTTIEEAKYMKSVKIDELIWSLQTFELNLDDSMKVKSKGERSITLKIAYGLLIPNASTIEDLQE
ncbi:hypothetical protein PVK06_026722 [Gossypium arboreum]|uniref:Gag-pol polyprotein n=1 Tax=Gossypium arboreum TaxID=29729 RepID=A0ABR0P0X3_GOSAR|nr:hypothetical protein PVK06_026722 [Gossypium arboreum]